MRYKFLYPIVFCSALAGCAGLSRSPSNVPVFEAAPAEQAPVAESAPALRTPAARSEALLVALTSLGVDYRNGGRSPVTGFDCSGLVAHVYEEAYGIRLPRDSRSQSEVGLAVSLDELEPGDLVFYDTQGRPFSHVGIYLGDGKFVHAPKTGSTVRVESLRGAYWLKRFNGARRIEPAL